MLDAIADLAVAIVTAIVELMAMLLNLFLSASWISAHGSGLVRFFYGLLALSALHLFAAMVLALSGIAGPALLSVVFNKWVMIVSLTLLVIGFTGSLAVRREIAEPSSAQAVITHVGSYVLVIAIVFGLASIWTTQVERRTLTERLCDAGAERISDGIKEQGNKALDLAERLLKRDLREKLPCRKAPEE